MALTKRQIASKTKQVEKLNLLSSWNCPFGSSDMPGCCGVDVLHDFEYDSNLWAYLFLDIYVHQSFRTKTLIATTIPGQKEAHTALKYCGFKAVGRSRNPNTNRVITTWILHLK